jgi:integrase
MADDRVFPFTTKRIEALPTPQTGRARYRDASTRGLGLAVTDSGHKSFFWVRKVKDYPQRKTLGTFPDLSVDRARDAADGWNRKLAEWKANGFAGPNPLERPGAAPTFGEVAKLYIERHLAVHAKNPPRAIKEAEGKLRNHLAGWLGRNLDDIRRADVIALHEKVKVKSGLYAANHLVQFVRQAINWAMASELYSGANPAKNVKMFREEKRRRFLLAPEIAALLAALKDRRTSSDLHDYTTIALLCGARKSDVLSMRWADVQLDRKTWLVPQPKNAEPYYVALTDEVVDILRERKALAAASEIQSPFVFPSGGARSGHRSDMKKEWKTLVERAGISDLRQHDLRRTLGSWQAAGGASLQIIGKSLGHKATLGSTSVYAQLELAPIRASIETAAHAMFTAAKAAARAAAKAAKKPKLLPSVVKPKVAARRAQA